MSNLIQFKRRNWIDRYIPATNEPYYIMDTNDLRVGSGSNSSVSANRPITSTYTFYVSPSGSATASGLSPSNTTTILGAVSKARELNWSGVDKVNIQLSNGTYTVSQSIFWQDRKNGPLHITGNPASPQSVIINSVHSQSYSGIFNAYYGGHLSLNGMSLQTSYADSADNYQHGLVAVHRGVISCNNIRFGGTFNSHNVASDCAQLAFGGTFNVYGKCRNSEFLAYQNAEIMIYNTTMSFSNNPSINIFCAAYDASCINNYNVTNFSGSNATTYKCDAGHMASISNYSQYPGTLVSTGSLFTGVY